MRNNGEQGNNAVTLLDASFLQNVLAGYYYLFDVGVLISSEPSAPCKTSVEVRMQGVAMNGRQAVNPENVAVYLDVASKYPALDTALNRTGMLVSTRARQSRILKPRPFFSKWLKIWI